jgi:hypothetical protein
MIGAAPWPGEELNAIIVSILRDSARRGMIQRGQSDILIASVFSENRCYRKEKGFADFL